jgi:type IV pilus assembly protein PilQ
MVKVASMRRAKRILVVGGVLLLCGSTADAGIWGSRKTQDPAAAAPVASAITLENVGVEGSRVMLRTNGAPAYTSYSPSPGVFVVDLTGTARGEGLTIPSLLPPAVTSIAADQVLEMGSTLTRITFRFAEPMQPEVSAIENGVVITVPAKAIAIETASTTPDVLPAVTPLASEAEADVPQVVEVPVVTEEVSAPAAATIVEVPYEQATPANFPKAKTVRRIEASSSNGEVEVRIQADGKLKYKAFRLENPSRLVLDLDGVRNAAVKNNVRVEDDVVKGVRIAQFQPTVARVVVDLTGKAEYDIVSVGDELRVAFGEGVRASTEARQTAAPSRASVTVAASEPPAPRPEPVARRIQVREAEADLPSMVPTIVEVPRVAESSSTWTVPEPASRGARSVIRPAVDQAAAPQQPATQENVFDQAVPAQTGAQNLSGARTLGGAQRVFTGEPISLNLKDADIKDVLATFAELTGLNIAVDPGVSGSVTVDFVDVPWDQALDLILRQNKLTFTIEGNVMRVGEVSVITEEAEATAKLEEQERLKVALTTLSFKLSYARAPEVSALLRSIASPRARIIVDPRTNQVIISEIPEVLRTMQNLIATVDIPSRQVMIEARIVESLRSFSQSWGFEWGFGGDLDPSAGTGTGLVFPNRIGYDAGPFAFSGGGNPVLSLSLFDVLGTFNLDLALHAAETQGFAKVVSAPRVTTQDNQSAEIQSGFQIPYQTRVNFTTTVQYLDATLRLSVTPQITEAGTVIMDIAVQKNEPATGLAIEGAAGTPLTTRQASTRLMVRDGGTAVIAGIFQTRDNSSQSRIPFVHNIPVIGALFRSHTVSTQHDELLIFITPRIVRG